MTISTTVSGKDKPTDSELRASVAALLKKDKAQAFRDDRVASAVDKRAREELNPEMVEIAEVEAEPVLISYVTGTDTDSPEVVDYIVDSMMKQKKTRVSTNKKGEKVVTTVLPMDVDLGKVAEINPDAVAKLEPIPDQAEKAAAAAEKAAAEKAAADKAAKEKATAAKAATENAAAEKAAAEKAAAEKDAADKAAAEKSAAERAAAEKAAAEKAAIAKAAAQRAAAAKAAAEKAAAEKAAAEIFAAKKATAEKAAADRAKAEKAKAEKEKQATGSGKRAPLPRAAIPYAGHVEGYSESAKVKPSLVYAVMETESAFNPMAKSSAPAYGLMQIVPRSAGQDATEKLFGKPKILSPSYLYNSENNIQIGTTYLNILYYRYLKGIQDPQSRLYCSIAAYNTGAGNVAKAFTGKRRIKPALEVINSMPPDQVYRHLRKNLPYEETQHYLVKVSGRIEKYED